MSNKILAVEFITQLTRQGTLEWFLDEHTGIYYTEINGWTIKLKGELSVFFVKGVKTCLIYANSNSEIKELLKSLHDQVKEQVYKNGEDNIASILEKQEEKVLKSFRDDLFRLNK